MAERFNVRNVAQKEVYDSYMGILRISPIEVNGKDIDDVTSILNTLVDIDGNIVMDGITEKNSIIKVRLSDSDGNKLPVRFIPKAFKQQVLVRKNNADSYQTQSVIHMTTKLDRHLFVSDNLTCRSTLIIDPTEKQKKVSPLQIGAKGASNTISNSITAKSILCYPIEAPNDEYYFNNKNELQPTQNTTSNGHFFDPDNSSKPRHEQVYENLLKQPRAWYENNFPIVNDQSPQRVKVAGRFINRYNNDGEEIPVLHTRDYVLGHYDGHSWSKASKVSDDFQRIWCGNTSKLNTVSDFDNITRLSWIRFDDLVWDSLDEILKGNVRHTVGRYNNLGTSKTESNDIRTQIFDRDNSKDDNGVLWGRLNQTAPLLGAGVEPGIIMYHAMPFHRYWFHRCRQVVQNLERRARLQQKNYNGNNSWYSHAEELSNHYLQAQLLQNAFNDKLITPCSMATITPVHSLSKDYLLCNGLDVTFENFPNISPTNDKLFDTKYGMPVDIDADSKKYKWNKGYTNDVYSALQITQVESFDFENDGKKREYGNDNPVIYLPNLFSLTEKSPRFIRGLDWDFPTDETSSDASPSVTPHAIKDEYGNFTTTFIPETYQKTDGQNKTIKIYYPSNKWIISSEDDDVVTLKHPVLDINGNIGFAFNRNFDKVKLHFYNYDHLVETHYHHHNLFSNHQGGIGDKEDLSYCYYYDYDANNGGSTHKRWTDKNTINRNFLYNKVNYNEKWLTPQNNKEWDENAWIKEKSQEWLKYCFYKDASQVFYNFTPIPNCGLFLFNGDIYNNPAKQDVFEIHIGKRWFKAESQYSKTGYTKQYKLSQLSIGGKKFYKVLTDLIDFTLVDEIETWVDQVTNKEYPYTGEIIIGTIPHFINAVFTGEGLTHPDGYKSFTIKKFKEKSSKDKLIAYIKGFLPTDGKLPSDFNKEQYLQNNDYDYIYFIEKDSTLTGDTKAYIGTVQKYEDENWNNFQYFDAQGNSHDFKSANISLQPANDWNKYTDNESKYQFLKKHAEAKERRRMLMIKMNESEAKIPISYVGKAQFSTRYYFTYERKRSWWSSTFGGDEWDTETEIFKMEKVGNYEIAEWQNYQRDEQSITPKWRCLTSLAYTDPQYLGFGIIGEDYDPEDELSYWNTHNVTDFFKSAEVKSATSANGKATYTTYGSDYKLDLDVQSPYPSHIKLLPLIRL